MSAASSPMASPASPPGRGFGARLAEYFTLRGAEAALARLSESARAEIAESIELARQQTAAAEALFAVGHTVEALRLGQEALASTETAAERYAAAVGVLEIAPSAPGETAVPPASEEGGASSEGEAQDAPADAAEDVGASKEDQAVQPAVPSPVVAPTSPAWKRLALASGLAAARVDATDRALAEVRKLPALRLEKDVSPAHVDAFRGLLRARANIEEMLAPATHTKGSLMGTRIWRGVSAGLVSLGLVLGAVYFLRPVEGTFVRASATWADSPDFRADFIIDGDPNTMWLLPESSGWVEVRTAPPIPEIHRVTLTNAGNSRVSDRGTQDYRLEIYADGRLEESIDGTFGDELGATVTHEVSVRNVERIRFVARSAYRVGAGLTELHWE